MRTPDRPIVTMADVARRAGVSKQTVSRVVNGHPSVRPETRKKIQETIDNLGFVPNAAARSLARAKTLSLLIAAPTTDHYGPIQLVHSVEDLAQDRGYMTTVWSLNQVEQGVPQPIGQHDALMLIDVSKEAVPHFGLDAIAPIVVDAPVASSTDGDVWGTDIDAGRQATNYLIEMGHVRIAHISGPSSWPSSQARAKGYTQAMRNAGLKPSIVEGDWSPASGYRCAHSLFDSAEATALFCANDEMAIGALAAGHDAGKVCPDDFSIVGFDDINIAGFYRPPLTTIRYSFRELARRYMQALDYQLQEPFLEQTPAAPYELIVRGSAGPSSRGTC